MYIHPSCTRVGFGTTAAESDVEIAEQEKNLSESNNPRVIKVKQMMTAVLACAGYLSHPPRFGR